ncbi:hypothetical protein [Burkholderia multivorans]|uniref:hypothetical protein n=1 Tax=Burkholderia multivorans TaxID=87883 RepID=UPI001C217F87|nr:hypothetical protein [Burkholderia multivorans]MBU9211673.1 hypothetical protein [Burkholderia multivorans]
MGILFDVAAFYRWLQEATDRELIARRDSLIIAIENLSDRDVAEEAKRWLKKIEQEIVARRLR